jgi:NodT family efflux transporter outer membrane factor (OMF) lipoprotein
MTRPPAPVPPAQWRNVKTDLAMPASEADGWWWEALGDERLDALMRQALDRNRDLARAALAVQQAQAVAASDEAARWPTLNATASNSMQRPLQANELSPAATTSASSTGAGASYAPDLWQRLSSAAQASRQGVALREADARAVRLLQTEEVARQYWTLAALDEKRPLAEADIEDAEAGVAAMKLRFEAGAERRDAVDRAEAALRQALLRREQWLKQREAARVALALLVDEMPQRFEPPAGRLPARLPEPLHAAPPAQVLDRRPDVQGARLALDAALLQADAARRNVYPDLNLGANVNAGSAGWRQWIANPLAALSLSLSLPVLDWQRKQIEQRQRRLDVEQAALGFRDSVVKALGEVEQAYAERRELDARWTDGLRRVDEARRALEVARLRHEAGAEAMQAVRDAEAACRAEQAALVDLRLAGWDNGLRLQQALGGPPGPSAVTTASR